MNAPQGQQSLQLLGLSGSEFPQVSVKMESLELMMQDTYDPLSSNIDVDADIDADWATASSSLSFLGRDSNSSNPASSDVHSVHSSSSSSSVSKPLNRTSDAKNNSTGDFPHVFFFTRRDHEALSRVPAANGTLVPLVDYMRRDKGNTSKGRSDVVGKRRVRPRYINLFLDVDEDDQEEVKEQASAVQANPFSFDLFKSNRRLVVGACIECDLEGHCEKGQLFRVNVDCITPEDYSRSGEHWFCLRVRSSQGYKDHHFMLKWWKAGRKTSVKSGQGGK